MSFTELSLFSGAGGGLLASKYLLGWKTIGYVEYEKYCQKVIEQRIKDGLLDAAPIFGDINKFIAEGYAKSYSGMVDVITAGFPCQEFSVAGKRKGKDGARNMWPQTIEAIKIIKPKHAFLENVPGLLSSVSGMDEIAGRPISYCTAIFRDLAEAGYNAKWTVLGAGDIGAPHKRKRLWILAHSTCF
jgi:DNA (cytosine-5)-methyltransferase 1